MSRKYLTHIDLNTNELQNAVIQNLSTAPTGVLGRIYFDTSSGVNKLKIYNGTSWQSVGQVSLTLTGDVTGTASTNAAGEITLNTTIQPNSIALGTDTTGNYVATISAGNGISVTGSGSENAGVTVTLDLSANDVNTALGYTAADAADVAALSTSINTGTIDATTVNTTDLNVTGDAFVGSNLNPNNRIATLGDLNSNAVVQSVSGTDHEIEVTDNGQGDVTVGLPDDVAITTSLTVGENWQTESYDNGILTVKDNTGATTFTTNAGNKFTALSGELEIRDQNGNAKLNITHSYTGTTRITTGDDLALRSNDGDIILYPGNDNGGTGKAYVHWGNDATGAFPEHEITTAGNTQTFTNKTVGDQLTFNDGSNNSTIDVDGNNLYINANNNLQLSTANGNITLNPDGYTQVNGELKAGYLVTPNIYGNESNGNLDLSDWNENSSIHIDGTSHDIELLPGNGGKAFYGSAVTAGNEIAKISDLQALSSGLSWKQAVNLLADTGQNFAVDNVGHSIDGHTAFTLADAGYRILLTGQTNTSENGIYELYVDGSTLLGRRTTDADTDEELKGAAVFVMEGNTYAGTSWVQNNHYISSFAGQDWVQFSGQGTYIGSDSIYLNGRSINVVADGDRGLNIDGDGTYVKIGDGIQFVGGNVSINPGTGFDTTSGALEFATGYGVRKYSETLSHTTNSWTVEHNLGTRDVQVQIYDAVTYEALECDIERTDENNVDVLTSTNPINDIRVVIIG